MKKNIFGFLLSICIATVMLTVHIISAPFNAGPPIFENEPVLYLGEQSVSLPSEGYTEYENTDETDSTWWVSKSGDEYTLTLNGAEITTAHIDYDIYGLFAEYMELNIILTPDSINSITLPTYDSDTYNYSFGVYVLGGLHISGSGRLEVTSGKAGSIQCFNISDSYEETLSGNLTISDGAVVIATTPDFNEQDFDGTVCAADSVQATNTIQIEDSTLEINNGSLSINNSETILFSRGIYSDRLILANSDLSIDIAPVSNPAGQASSVGLTFGYTDSGIINSSIDITLGEITAARITSGIPITAIETMAGLSLGYNANITFTNNTGITDDITAVMAYPIVAEQFDITNSEYYTETHLNAPRTDNFISGTTKIIQVAPDKTQVTISYDSGDFAVNSTRPIRFDKNEKKLIISEAGEYNISMKDGKTETDNIIEVDTENYDDEILLNLDGINITAPCEKKALCIVDGDVSISCGQAVYIRCADNNGPLAGGWAIFGDFTFIDGNLSAYGGKANQNIGGVGIYGNLRILDGIVSAFGGNSVTSNGGHGIVGSVDIEGGTLNAHAGYSDNAQPGKGIYGDLTVSGEAEVFATSDVGGHAVENTIIADAGTVIMIEQSPESEPEKFASGNTSTAYCVRAFPEPHIHSMSCDCSTDNGTQIEFFTMPKEFTGGTISGGNYVLKRDLVLTRSIIIDDEVNICLNGYMIKQTAVETALVVEGTLNLCDCNLNRSHVFSADAYGLLSPNGEIGRQTIYGGVIAGQMVYRDFYNDSDYVRLTGGAVRVKTDAVFNMYGGNLCGNQAYLGAGVYSTGTFNMYGGIITGNVTDGGGTIEIAGGNMSISGRSFIVYNYSNYKSANILLHDDASPITISGAMIGLARVFKDSEQDSVVILNAADGYTISNIDFANFSSDKDDHTIKFSDNKIVLCKYYSVSYNGNGNTSGSVPVDEEKYLSGDKATLLENSGGLEKTDCTFSGWITGGDNPVKYQPEDEIEISGNIELFADWEGNEAITPTVQKVTGAKLSAGYREATVSVTASAAEGHTLLYQWYVNSVNSNEGGTLLNGATSEVYELPVGKSAGTTEYYYCLVTARRSDNGNTSAVASAVATVTIKKRSIVTAEEDEEYTVKFDTNGGTAINSKTVKANAQLPKITPTKEGFVFGGWYTDKELSKPFDENAQITASVTLYAKWNDAAKGGVNEIVLTIDKKQAFVFGEEKSNDVAPIIRQNRTMLPARFIAELLGAIVSWDAAERKVTIEKGEIKIIIFIDSDKAYVNGVETILDSPAFIENDRTYTPLRFVAENLGADVVWIEAERKVVVTKK